MSEHKQIIIMCGAVQLQIINGHLHFSFIRMVIVGWLAAKNTNSNANAAKVTRHSK
jgi:hypothetical protein